MANSQTSISTGTDTINSDTLPILDYRLLESAPQEFNAQLQHALLNVGFFYLSNVDSIISKQLWDDVFEQSRLFFELPVEEKEEIEMSRSRHFRGWSRFKDEKTQGRIDNREQIDFGPETEPAISYSPTPLPEVLPFLNLYGPNLFPKAPEQFKSTYLTYYNASQSLAFQLLNSIARSLTSVPERLTDLFTTPPQEFGAYSRAKVVRYPFVGRGDKYDGLEAEESGLGVGAHKDGGGLTMLMQDDVGGLQVQKWDGTWIDAVPKPYHIVVNVGQQIEYLSSGLYPATTHRVLRNGSFQSGSGPLTSLSTNTPSPTAPAQPRHRHSIPFFLSPSLTSTLRPLLISEVHPHLRQKVEERGKEDLKSDVVKGDLHGDRFGEMAWKGICRSHEKVREKWYGEYFK